MRPEGLLHAELLGIIASMGHGQTLVVADAGLPIPDGVRRIDLAVVPGTPGFLPVLAAVAGAGAFEAATIADELLDGNPALADVVRDVLREGVPIDHVPHERFRERCANAVAVVRTGEFTPYANVILRAGVAF